MATKNTKLAGRLINGQTEAYWLNAAKQIPWPISLDQNHISVPTTEVYMAGQNLMVQHFVNAGFFIQTCIPDAVPENKVFDPEIRLKLPAVKIVPDDAIFHIGDGFEIKSTGCKVEIEAMESKKIHLRYTNRDKHNLLSSEEMLVKNLNWGL